MARGQKSRPGDTRIAPNGYHYTRTKEGWQLTHRIVVERKLGRGLEPDERVRFKDGNRDNIEATNLEVYKIRQGSLQKRKARIEARIEELQIELKEIERALAE